LQFDFCRARAQIQGAQLHALLTTVFKSSKVAFRRNLARKTQQVLHQRLRSSRLVADLTGNVRLFSGMV